MPLLEVQERSDTTEHTRRPAETARNSQAAFPPSATRTRMSVPLPAARPGAGVELPPSRYQQPTEAERQQRIGEADRFFAKPVTESRMRRLVREELKVRSEVLDTARIDAYVDARRLDRISFALEATELQLPLLRRYLHTNHGQRVIEEVRMDSIARTLRGKEPYDLLRETIRRVLPTVRALVIVDIQQRYRKRHPAPQKTTRSATTARGRGLSR